jgi:predicted dehydrogenase
MIKVAQIGCGYWGPNLLRNFNSIKSCAVVAVIEPKEERQDFLKQKFPHIDISDNISAVFSSPDIDGVIIATPAHLHFEQAKQALLTNKHVFVEKPMATSSAEVEELSEIAHAKRLNPYVWTYLPLQ